MVAFVISNIRNYLLPRLTWHGRPQTGVDQSGKVVDRDDGRQEDGELSEGTPDYEEDEVWTEQEVSNCGEGDAA